MHCDRYTIFMHKNALEVRMTTTNFSVRMDSDIKKQCEELYGEL